MKNNFAPSRRHVLRTALAACAAATACLAATEVAAQGKPNSSQTLRLIVPFPPGSAADSTARVFAKVLGELAGQTGIVENRPGANGIPAVQAMLGAPADGHTIFFGSSSHFSTNAVLIKKMPYDPLKDLAPLSGIIKATCVIIVPANSPYRTLQELVADARKRPGALNYGSGSTAYTLYTEWLNEMAGIKTTNIAFKGAGDTIIAVAGGQIDFAVVEVTGPLELIKSGRIRALAYTDTARFASLPDVPGIAEAGQPDFLASGWVGAAVSSRTPEPILRELEALIQKAGASKEVVEYTERLGMTRWMSTPQEMHEVQLMEIARWKRVALSAGVEAQ